jgi:hypothetical protein
MSTEIVNKVTNSGLITLNLEDFYHPGERVVYDLRQNLFQDLILKERDFRAFVKSYSWEEFKDKNVSIICSVDVIVPTWAYMLLASVISPYANIVVFGDLEALEQALFQQALSNINADDYADQRIVIKGCGDIPVPVFAYTEIVRKLQPVAKSIMYGEPCSTVPIYKAELKPPS